MPYLSLYSVLITLELERSNPNLMTIDYFPLKYHCKIQQHLNGRLEDDAMYPAYPGPGIGRQVSLKTQDNTKES
jgi:hypothetical protein